MKGKDYSFYVQIWQFLSESYWTQDGIRHLKVTYTRECISKRMNHSGKYNEIVQSGIELWDDNKSEMNV